MADDYINDQREKERQDAISTSSSSFIKPIISGLGAIGLGALVFGNKLGLGGNYLANTLHFLGHGRGVGISKALDTAASIGKAATNSGLAGARSIATTTYDVSRNTLHLGPIDLIDTLRSSLEIMGATRGDIGRKIGARVTEYVHRQNVAVGGLFSSYFGHDLQRVTMGEVLSDSESWKKLIGSNQWDTLKNARKAGLIADDTILNKNIYRSSSGSIKDTRLSNIFNRLDVFGQAEVFRSIKGSNIGVAVLGPTKEVQGPRFFIGGDIFAYTQKGEEVLVGTGKKLRNIGDPLDAVSGTRQGRLVRSKEKIDEYYSGRQLPKGLSGALANLEYTTGIGFSYSSRPSLLERYVINPIRRYTALATGDAVIFQHPYKMDKSASKIADAVLGGEYPELVRKRGVPVKIGEGKQVGIHELGALDRLKTIFDLSDEYSVVKRSSMEKRSASYKLSNKDLYIPVSEGGLGPHKDSFISKSFLSNIPSLKKEIVTKAGEKVSSYKPAFYDVEKSRVPGLTNLSDFANYLFYRVNSLASESLLGIGFAPGKTVFGSALRLAAIPLIYEAARESLNYADYILEKTTGVSPKKLAADVYASARLVQQSVRQFTGLQQSFDWLDDNYPGSVNSEGSFFLRTLVGPAAILTAALKLPKGGYALGAAGAGIALLAAGGPNPNQSYEDLKAEYDGDKKVPIRKSRLWGLGYTPLFGGAPEYFDYSWYYKQKNDASYVGTYGSKEEYFRYNQNVFGIPLPTPSNWLGLRNVFNPYRWEEQNYNSRPYPQTGGKLEEFPIIGPALAGTIGKLIKPTRYRSAEEMPLLKAGLADRGLQPSTARMLGIPSLNATEQQIDDPYAILERMRKFGDVALEPVGVYKFAMEFFGVSLRPSGRPREATSDIATSEGRAFYGKNYGGAFGQTEFIRRFMLSEYNSQYSIQNLFNPIDNTMPDWLPGSRSRNTHDQDYFIDFSKGDPYTKISQGESRLPGKLHDILSKRTSVGPYDMMEKFSILADIAPYSSEYRTLERTMLGMNLPKDQLNKIKQIINQKKQVIGVDTRYLRQEDEIIDLNKETISRSRSIYDTVTHDFLAEIPIIGSKLFPFRNPYEQYRKLHVEGSTYANWNRPYEDVIRPMAYDMAYEDPLTAGMKGAVIGGVLAGPMSFFNPVKALSSHTAGSIIGGAGIGIGLSTTRILSGNSQNSIPGHVQRESQLADYTDKFLYMKARMYQTMAEENGNSALASQFSSLSKKTMVGANNPIMLRASLPTSLDRRYFDYFMKAPSHSREELIAGLPSHMSSALSRAYGQDYPSVEAADQETAAYFSVNSLPSASYLGWHPDIPSQAVRLNMVQHGINGISDNMHRFGFFESQSNELKNRLPDLYNSTLEFNAPKDYRTLKELMTIKSRELNFGSSFNISSNPFTSLQNITTYDNQRTDKTYYMQEYMR